MHGLTSMENLYSAIEAVIIGATGRSCWKKTGIQAQPQGPYSTLYLTQGAGLQNPVVETYLLQTPTEAGEDFLQVPWGTQLVRCQVEFLRNGASQTANQAANQFANSLRLYARFYDLWKYCAMSGETQITDISAIFRADIEPRTRVEFSVYANIADKSDQSLEDNNVYDIEHQPVTIEAQVMGTTLEPIESVTFDNTGG